MKSIESKLNEFRSVTGFQCPAEFWPALGYEGEARYVAIYWERSGDEASWADGGSALCGADWEAYRMLVDHNFAPGHPARWLLGSSEEEAAFWLVVDRVTEWAWLVPADEGPEVLRLQWPELVVDAAEDGPGVLGFEDFEVWLERVTAKLDAAQETAGRLSYGELAERIREQVRRDVALEKALAERKANRAQA